MSRYTNDSLDYTVYMDDDGDGFVDRFVEPDHMSVRNAPYRPSKPGGYRIGYVGDPQELSVDTIDPEDDPVQYQFDWGDGSMSERLGPYASGDICLVSNIWTEAGYYEVAVRALDDQDHGSDWSEHLGVYITDAIATIDIDPDVLNLGSDGRWITRYIELPYEYDPEDIDVGSILFNNTIPADLRHHEVEDDDHDGIPELKVKFDREEVQNILMGGESVEVFVTGMAIDEVFTGSDIIQVIGEHDDDCDDDHHGDCEDDED